MGYNLSHERRGRHHSHQNERGRTPGVRSRNGSEVRAGGASRKRRAAHRQAARSFGHPHVRPAHRRACVHPHRHRHRRTCRRRRARGSLARIDRHPHRRRTMHVPRLRHHLAGRSSVWSGKAPRGASIGHRQPMAFPLYRNRARNGAVPFRRTYLLRPRGTRANA